MLNRSFIGMVLTLMMVLAALVGCEGNGGACHPRAASRAESPVRCDLPRKPAPPMPVASGTRNSAARELSWGLASNASLPNRPAERPVSANCNTDSCDTGSSYFYVGVNVNDGYCGPYYNGGYWNYSYNCGPNWNGNYWNGGYRYSNWNNCNTNWNRGWNGGTNYCPPPRQNCPTPPRGDCR